MSLQLCRPVGGDIARSLSNARDHLTLCRLDLDRNAEETSAEGRVLRQHQRGDDVLARDDVEVKAVRLADFSRPIDFLLVADFDGREARTGVSIQAEILLALACNQLGPALLAQYDSEPLERHPSLIGNELVERSLDVGSQDGHLRATSASNLG